MTAYDMTMQRRRGKPRRSFLALLVLWLATLLVFSAGGEIALAQRPIQIDPRLPRKQPPAGRPAVMPSAGPPFTIVEVSAPIQNLLDRAEEGIARSDWKFAIDSLQRIIDNPEGSMVLRDGATSKNEVYESARRQAIGRLASLPAEGIAAYRSLYDGRSKGIFERAEKARDAAGLRSIVQRFPLTAHADDAAELLASWALDEGRAAEAAALLENLAITHPESDLPAERVHGKLAAAYARMGRIDAAVKEIAHIETTDPDQFKDAAWMRNFVTNITTYEEQLRALQTVAKDWPMAGGSTTRHGVMAAVNPALNREAPWSFEQQTVEYSYWARQAEGETVDALPMPAAQLAAANGRLFIRTGRGCAALDADDLSLIWDAPLSTEGSRFRAELKREQGRIVRDTGDFPGRTADDEVGGAIAVAHGLVFTIENFGQSGEIQERDAALFPPRLGFMTPNIPMRSTRLVAREATTGEVKWSRGRGTDATDPLGAVNFRGMPIPIGTDLWVPLTRQSDLLLGVLDPRDGSLKQSIVLCALGNPLSAGDRTLMLTHSDGMVFAASGAGAVFAVDAVDMAPVWASAYVETQRSGTRRVVSDEDDGVPQLSSAPIAVGGLILVAPPDRTELLAFDRMSGDIRWTLALDVDSYLVGTRKDRFWLGGRELTCHQAIDRQVLWRKKLAEPATGRAILAGKHLLVPTLTGVSRVDAATGELADTQPLPPPFAPLGQLLSLNHSLYSFDSIGVRRFVDLEQLYPEVVAAHAAAPEDAMTRVRLARLELLRGDAARARELLTDVDSESAGDDRLRAAARKTLVRASLALAETPGWSKDEIVAELDAAGAAAWDAQDRVSCVLAKADYLLHAGEQAEAAAVLLEAAASADADEMRAVSPAVTGQGRIAMAIRLQSILPQLDDAGLQSLSAAGRKKITEAVLLLKGPERRQGLRMLRAIGDLPSVAGTMESALLKLALAQSADSGKYEAAEQLLLECRRRTREKYPWSAAALMQLIELRMTLPVGEGGSVSGLLDELERDYGDNPTPAFAAADADAPNIREWVAGKRKGLPAPASAAHLSIPPASFRVLNPAPAWTWQPDTPVRSSMGMTTQKKLPRLVRFESPTEGVLSDRLVLFDDEAETMLAVGLRDRAALWSAPLRRPGTFRDESGPWNGGVITALRRAGVDGQTAVMCGHEGIFAVGLLTGKRLWLRPYETTTPYGHMGVREVTTAAGNGLVAAMPRAGKLTALRLTDGATLWERDVRAEPVTYVRIMSDVFVTLDDWLERVTLIAPADGSVIKQVRFRQPDPKKLIIPLVHTGGVLCGPDRSDGGDEVVGYQVRSGEALWRLTLDKPLAALFEPAEGIVGVALLGGEVRLVRVSDGEVQASKLIQGAQAVADGVLRDGLFITQLLSQTSGSRQSELVAIDVATGEQLWRRNEIRALAGLSDDFAVFGGQLVAVVDYSPAGSKVKRVGLTVIDVRTGESMGPTVDLPQVDQRMHFDGEVGVWPDTVVVQHRDSMIGYTLKPMETGAGG